MRGRGSPTASESGSDVTSAMALPVAALAGARQLLGVLEWDGDLAASFVSYRAVEVCMPV
ncbi:MAG TPA: hypothetical protein VH107_15320 [Lacipirellulaceae bacterium]|nr:hypothetical protein [Lacipirellulaceae bacterium]